MRFRAFRAHTVREVRIGVAGDVRLQLLPFSDRVPDLLAGAANPQQAAQARKLPFPSRVRCPLGLDPLGHVDAAPDVPAELALFVVERNAPMKIHR